MTLVILSSPMEGLTLTRRPALARGRSLDADAVARVVFGLLCLGFAIGFPALNIQAVSGVPDHEQGLASGLFNTSSQVGGAVVLAVVTAVISSQSVGVTTAAGMLSAYKPGLGVVTGIAALGLLIALTGLRGRKARRAAEETEAAELAAVQDELAEEEMTPAA